MSQLAHLYVKTPQGRVTAFNPGAELPAPLKILLKAVDGKTTTSGLEAAYASLGDVAILLDILRSNGLIVDKNDGGVKTSPAPLLADTAPWVNSDNSLLDSSFGDFGTSMFGSSSFPNAKKPG
jgi:hypothetical protein